MVSRHAEPWCLVRIAHVVDDPEPFVALLDANERSRLDRLREPTDRRRFVTAAALLRVTVGAELGCDPAGVEVERTCPDCGRPHGRPRILGTAPELHVSVSHAGDMAVVAMTRAGSVGVDVERIPDTYLDVIDTACHPDERSAIRTARDFAITWVRKESVLKADGAGLRHDPASVVVSAPGEPASVRSMPGRPATAVRLHDIAVDGRHVGAVAVLTGEPIGIRVEAMSADGAGSFSARHDRQ